MSLVCYVEPKKLNTCYVIYFCKIQEETKLTYDEGNQNRDCLWWPTGLSGEVTRKFWLGGWRKCSRSWLVVITQMHIFVKTHQIVYLLCLSMYANWALVKKLNWKESQAKPVPEAGDKIGNRAGRALSRGSFCLAPVLINDRAGGQTEILLPLKSFPAFLHVALTAHPRAKWELQRGVRQLPQRPETLPPKDCRLSSAGWPLSEETQAQSLPFRLCKGCQSFLSFPKDVWPQDLTQKGNLNSVVFLNRGNIKYSGPDKRILFWM